jgi:intraflagellar transport protein 52
VDVYQIHGHCIVKSFLTVDVIRLPLDCVVRTHYYKYFHPKECLVANGILNRAIAVASGKFSGSDPYDHNNSQ